MKTTLRSPKTSCAGTRPPWPIQVCFFFFFFYAIYKREATAVLTGIVQDVSEQAKEHSKKVLESYDEPYDASKASHGSAEQEQHKDPGNVARGLKASISNPGVSEEAKKKAQEKLNALG